MEEDQNSGVTEVAPQDQDATVVEDNSTTEKTPVADESHDSKDKQDKNWREVRRKQRDSEIREKAKDEIIEKLLKAKQAEVLSQKALEPDEFDSIAKDDYPTWGQTDRRIDKRAEAIAEKKYMELERQKDQANFLKKLTSKYSDFQDVVNADSIALLEKKEPELAATIADLKDPYKMGFQTYHYLKKSGLGDEVVKEQDAKESKKKLKENEKVVQSPQAFNKRPMAEAFKLTKSEKTKLYEEMMSAASRTSGY